MRRTEPTVVSAQWARLSATLPLPSLPRRRLLRWYLVRTHAWWWCEFKRARILARKHLAKPKAVPARNAL